MSVALPRVLVAVTTYRRTELLPELLRAIAADAALAPCEHRVLLVDNDPQGSAAPVAERHGVGHLLVPEPGIAAARQAALDAAEDDELLAMLDDDLVPEPGWLAGLVDAWGAHRPEAVMGFVRYVWPETTDPWVAAGGFMRRTRFETGRRLSALSTGNVLLDPSRIRRLGVRFDPSLGLSGGSDLDFGHRLLAAGGVIVASAESVARDDIDPSRTTRAFVRHRAICQGQVRVRMLSRDDDRTSELTKRAGHLVGGVLRVPVFAVRAAAAHLRGDVAGSAVQRRRLWFAQGRVLGALGRYTHEYARPPAAHDLGST